MFSKNRSKLLWVTLVVLLVLLFVLQYTDRRHRSIPETLVSIDTTDIDNIYIHLPNSSGSIQMTKSGNKWKVEQDGQYYQADQQKVRHLLGSLLALKPQSMAAKSSQQWSKFQVNDSLGTRLTLKTGNTTKADLLLGRISIKMPKTQAASPYQQQQQQILMYARPYDDEKVFLTDGMLKLEIGRQADDYRIKLFCKLKTGDIGDIKFSYSKQPSFALQKQDDGKWLIDDNSADSLKVEKYLKNFLNSRGSRFVNNFIADPQQQYAQVTVQGNGIEPLVLTAYQIDSTHFVLHSSMNSKGWFAGEAGNLFEKFFVQKDYFTVDAKK